LLTDGKAEHVGVTQVPDKYPDCKYIVTTSYQTKSSPYKLQ